MSRRQRLRRKPLHNLIFCGGLQFVARISRLRTRQGGFPIALLTPSGAHSPTLGALEQNRPHPSLLQHLPKRGRQGGVRVTKPSPLGKVPKADEVVPPSVSAHINRKFFARRNPHAALHFGQVDARRGRQGRAGERGGGDFRVGGCGRRGDRADHPPQHHQPPEPL